MQVSHQPDLVDSYIPTNGELYKINPTNSLSLLTVPRSKLFENNLETEKRTFQRTKDKNYFSQIILYLPQRPFITTFN